MGSWGRAYEVLEAILVEYPTDGPSIFLRDYIKSKQTGEFGEVQCPDNWMGYRMVAD